MSDPSILIFYLIVLIFSVIIHEVSHGFVAYYLGDNTAKDAGRLTLNPISHIDPIGSILVPLILVLVGSPVLFGWAKPVPFNPNNLRNLKSGSGWIGLAGPASNFILAGFFAIILKIAVISGMVTGAPFSIFLNIIILVNVVLGAFNLVPIPPLDGSRILFAILPRAAEKFQMSLERWGLLIVIIFIYFASFIIYPVISWLFHLFGGTII